jgi:uncharacterized protein
MYLDLMDVLRTPGHVIEREINLAPTTLDDIEIAEPVRGMVRVTNARQSLVVSGNAHTAINMECSRCLGPTVQPLDLEFEAAAPLSFFQARLEGVPDEESEADDEMAALFDAHSLDVLELIRQAIVLQAPIQPLCRPDCPGLAEAANYKDISDERWSALKKWKEEDNGST